MQSILNSLQYGMYFFIFTTLLVDATNAFSQPYLRMQPTLQSPPKIRSSTSFNSHLPILPLLVHKIVLTIPTNNSFLYTSAISHLPLFSYNHLNNLHQKYFPTSTMEPGSLVRRLVGSIVKTDTVLISPFYIKVWTVITGLPITELHRSDSKN